MKNIIRSQANTLNNDLWNAITDMLEKDGIDYMNEKDVLKLTSFDNGDQMLVYKDKPYCLWTQPKIEFGKSDEFETVVRAEIILKKI